MRGERNTDTKKRKKIQREENRGSKTEKRKPSLQAKSRHIPEDGKNRGHVSSRVKINSFMGEIIIGVVVNIIMMF